MGCGAPGEHGESVQSLVQVAFLLGVENAAVLRRQQEDVTAVDSALKKGAVTKTSAQVRTLIRTTNIILLNGLLSQWRVVWLA